MPSRVRSALFTLGLIGLSLGPWLQAVPGAVPFLRGDADGSRIINISDPITIFGHLFLGAPMRLNCRAAADVNAEGAINITDGIYLLTFLFLGGPEPMAPFPACGADPKASPLGCDSYPDCGLVNLPPVAAFTASTVSGTVPLEVTFDASASSDPDGFIASFLWDFGDGATSAGKVTTHRFDDAGTRTVTLTVTDDQQASAITARNIVIDPPDAPTSLDLIQKALEAGEIDRETAVVYAVLASYGDPRLPAPFQGLPSEGGEAATWELEFGFNGFTAEHQALLAPYSFPPAADGSWLEIQEALQPGDGGGGGKIQWQTVISASGRIKVWSQNRYLGDRASAEYIASQVDDIWDDMAAAFGNDHMPPSDGGITDKPNGGDGLFDIYLVHLPGSAEGRNKGYKSAQCSTCSFVLVDPRGRQRTCRSLVDIPLSAVAHELMHGVQRTFPGFVAGSKNLWFMEATATWEESHYDKEADCEHTRAFDFFERPDVSLDYAPFLTEDLRRYEAYLWPFYLELKTGGTAVLKSIFEKLAGMSPHAAIDSTIAGGYRERFPEFALYNYNQESLTQNYQFDQIKTGARTSELPSGRVIPSKEQLNLSQNIVSMGGKGALDFDLPYSIPNLSAVYYQFYFPDPEARWVLIDHLFIIPQIPGRLQILYQIEGDTSWHHRDLTKEKAATVEFCRDKRDQRLERLVIIISNSEWTSAGDGKTLDQLFQLPEPPRLRVRNAGCWRWEGEVKATSNYAFLADSRTTILTSKVALQRVFSQNPQTEDPLYGYFHAVSRDTDWSDSEVQIGGMCSGSGDGQLTDPNPNERYSLRIDYKPREYFADGNWTPGFPSPVIHLTCENIVGGLNVEVNLFSWWNTPTGVEEDLRLVKDSGLLDETYVAEFPSGSYTWTWNLKPISEP